MNQLFYNIAGGIVHQIRSEKRTTTSEVIVRGNRNKQIRNWLYFNFSVESSSFIFTNFKTEKFKLTFKGWHRPVCHLFGFTRVSSCKNSVAFHPRTVKRIVTALMPSLLFRCFVSFSASFKNSSPREKVGNLSSLLGNLVGNRVSVSIYCREI